MNEPQHAISDISTVTILGRLVKTRWAWVLVLLVALDLGVLTLSARELIALLSAADVGLLIRPGTEVDAFDERWPMLQRRDHIVAWQGKPVSESGSLMGLRLAQAVGPLEVTFEREGRRFVAQAQATPVSASATTAVLVRWLAGMLMLLIGLAVFALIPGTKSSWTFLGMTQCLGVFLQAVLVTQRSTERLLPLAATLVLLATGFVASFLVVFPSQLPSLRRSVVTLWVPLGVNLVLFVAATFTESRGLSVATQIFGSLYPVVLALVFAREQRRFARSRKDGVAEARLRSIFVAMVLGLFFPLVADLVRRSMGFGLTPWSSFYNGAPTLLFVAMSAWVSVKHNAFDIDRFTSALVGYGATLSVLVVAGAAVLLGLPLALGPRLGGSPVATVAITAACFVAALPLYGRLKQRVDRLFFRTRADAGTLARQLHELSVAVQTHLPDEALRAGLKAALELGVERAELWRLNDEGVVFQRLRQEGVASTTALRELPRDGALSGALLLGAGGVQGLSDVVLPTAAQPQLWALELALAAPLQAHGVLAGFLAVSRKRSGLAFSLDEVTFLKAVAVQLGLVFERASGERLQFGRYRIERRLGVGGMAEVHLAWRLGPGGFERKVALKRPLPQLADDEVAVGMFLDEARIAAQLSHANIVQVYEVDRVDHVVFMALEYVDGPSLREVLKSARSHSRPLPAALAVRLTSELLSALDHAHRCRDANGRPLELVHRDVNPNNVLLSRDGRVKLTDFGIARAASRIASTRTGTVKGTLPYMAPEQARGERLDVRADLFSVASMLYEMLSLQRAYPEGPLGPVPPPLETLREDVPPPLLEVVARGMAFDRELRFSSAQAFRDALAGASAQLGRATEADLADWIAALSRSDSEGPGPDVTRTSSVPPLPK